MAETVRKCVSCVNASQRHTLKRRLLVTIWTKWCALCPSVSRLHPTPQCRGKETMSPCVSQLGLPWQVTTEWVLQQQAFISHSFRGWEAPQSGCRYILCTVRSLFLACRQPYPCCILTWQKAGGLSHGCSYKSTNPIMRLHLRDLMTFQRPHLQISLLGLRLQQICVEAHDSVHSGP